MTIKLALHRAVETVTLRPVARLVLVVDQLEELFTLDTTSRRGFANLLEALAASGSVWLLATMRSDFFHRLAEVPALHGLASGDGLYHLAPPRAEEIQPCPARRRASTGHPPCLCRRADRCLARGVRRIPVP